MWYFLIKKKISKIISKSRRGDLAHKNESKALSDLEKLRIWI